MTQLWHKTRGYGGTAPAVGYLDAAQNARLERIRVARALWQGRHRRVYLEEGRTQFAFDRMRVEGSIRTPYCTFNVLRLVTTTITDLLLSAEPLLKSDDARGQEAINDLVRRSELHRVLYGAARAASWAGEAFVEIIRYEGEVFVQNLRSDEIFPLGRRTADGQFETYRRFATLPLAAGAGALLLETTYEPGLIRRACSRLDAAGRRQADAPMEAWNALAGVTLADEEPTGIDWPTIVYLANEDDEGTPTSDYDGLIELQDELNAKQTQIAVVIAKHADPKMAVPDSLVGPDGNIRADAAVYFVRNKEEIPAYITWNAELAAAIEDREFTLHALCTAAELPPVLLGLKSGPTPDSGRKLRLEANKGINRAARKGLYVSPFVRTVLDTAAMYAEAGRAVKLGPAASGAGASVELRDGLPADELDEANRLSILTGGKPVMSVRRAVEQQLADPAAAEAEMARLAAEAKAAGDLAMPAMFAEPERENADSETRTANDEGTQPGAAVPRE